MTDPKTKNTGKPSELRKLAEQKANLSPENTKHLSSEKTQQVLHELRVHQIELEMQNDELRTSQSELKAARARYFDLYELAPLGYCTVSEKDLILEANLTATVLLGAIRGSMVKRPFSQFIIDEDQDIYYLHRNQLFKTKEPQSFDLRMLKNDGTMFWANLATTVSKNSEGNSVHRVAISDITERKRAEEAFIRMAQEWQKTFDFMSEAVWILDKDQVVLRSNKAAEAYFHMPCSEMVGKHCWEIVHGTAQAIPDCPYMKARKSFHHESMDLQVGEGWFDISVNPILDADGKPAGAVHVVTDITDRKKMEEINQAKMRLLEFSRAHTLEELLEESLNEIERLTGSLVGFCHFLEVDQKTIWLQNWSTRTKSEFCRAEGKGRHHDIAQAGVWADCIRERRPVIHNDYSSLPHRKGLPPGHAPVIRELVVPIFRGEKIMAVMGVGNKPTAYGDKDVEFVSLLANLAWDIAEVKKSEEEKAKLEAQLLQSQKLEAVGQLAGGIAHDFNNMLSVITGYSEIVLSKMNASDPNYSRVQEINRAGQRSADLTRQLLTFARKQTIAPKVLDLNVTLAGMLNMFQRLIGENISLLWKPSASIWKVKMDPSQIDQILANLIVNTRDAISGIGKVIIETGNAEVDEVFCKGHPDFVPGKYVVLSVSDNGCGMRKEILDHIFEPFYTTKEVGKGTGLGLATIFGIVKQNNGFIDVYSEPGKGTTFKIYMPWHDSKNGEIGEEYKKPKILKGTETILLVEDETALLQFAKASLEQLGYTVLPADTPVKAIQLSGEYKEVIHLLMTDVIMPGMNGRDLRDRIISTRPEIHCLFMSGYTAEIIADKGILNEDIDFLQKPFTAEALSVKVREALA